MKKTLINIVLFEPEIPQNTGNIMRTCVGTNCKLHLIKPFGFDLSDKQLKRSGVNYIDKLKYEVYENYTDFLNKNKGIYIFLTRYGKKKYSDVDFKIKGTLYLIFGKESTGIPLDILKKNIDNCYRIPTSKNVRSLNLSNSVSIVVYEVLRQNDFFDLSIFEPHKIDYL